MDKGYLVFLQLKDRLPDASQMAIRDYIKMYASEAGWEIPGVVFALRYVKFRLRRPSSRPR